MKIKVIYLVYRDNYGGASVAMKRINKAVLTHLEIESTIAVVNKTANDNYLYSLSNNLFEKIWSYLRIRIANKLVQMLQKTDRPIGNSINLFLLILRVK